MTLADELKTLDDKILEKQLKFLHYHQKNWLDKYEYLTREDLEYKPVEKAKFENFPSGKVFNKKLEKEDKKEELLKRLKKC